MADEPKNCPDCGSPMKLNKRTKPDGTMFVGNDRWICTNPKCGRVLEAEEISN